MNWARNDRRPDRLGCRPACETLELRQLLSSLPAPTPVDQFTGAAAVWTDYGATGAGFAAAVIDTGVNYLNPALGGGIGPGKKVVGGYDFAANDDDPSATWQHGTSVAGLIASADPARPGMAPGANIVALRVFGDDNRGSYENIVRALQWALDNHDRFNITVVNISISDNANYVQNWFARDGDYGQRISELIQQLRLQRIPVVAAAGNGFKGSQGMGFVAILPETISVTATDLKDQFAPDAQRLGTALGGTLATDLAAPGIGLEAPSEGNSFARVDGTSFAAPIVTGAILLLQSIYHQRFHQLPTVEQLESWLRGGAVPVSDPVTGISVGRLDVARAAALIPPSPGPVAVPSTVPAVTQPAEPSQVEQALTQLYQDGKLIGTIPAHTAGSPLEDAFAAFGLEGTFQKISTWKGSLMTDAFSAYQLEGTFQTLSTWNATRKSSTTAPGNPSPSGASRPLPEPSPVLQVPRSEKLGLFDRVWSWLRNLRGRSAR